MDVDSGEEELQDSSNDHMMPSLVDVFQMSGVPVADAVAYALKAVTDLPPSTTIPIGACYNPTLFDVYGQGHIIKASHGCRRDLNVNGFNAWEL